jgi:hypothetical protein
LAYLAHAEAHDLGYLASYVRMPLSQALAASGEAEQAVRMADDVIEHLLGLGCSGLNLALAYDTRARLAVKAEDEEGFARYSALSLEHSGQAGKRLERARRTHLSPKFDPNGLASELTAALHTAVHLHDRAQRALALLCRRAGAEAGAIYWLSDAGLECVARCGDLSAEAELDRSAQLHFDGQVLAQAAATSEIDAMEASATKPVSTTGKRYLPIMLGQDESEGHRYTGIAVLVSPMATEVGWMTALSTTLTTGLTASEFRGG